MEQVVSFLFKYKEALFAKSQFGFGARPSLFIIIALVVLAAALLYFLYAAPSVRLPAKWRASLIALRLVLLAVIVFCLMRPVIVVPSVVPQSSYVAVLMDDSASMKLADERDRTRLDSIKQLMTPGNQFFTALSEKFKVRPFKFSAAAERAQDATELGGAGEQTNLALALEQAARETAGLPLTAFVVMSDGASNGEGDVSNNLASTLSNLRARGLPVFTVGIGPTRLEGDIEVVRATAPRRVLAGSPVTAELLLRAGGESKSVKIELVEDSHLLRSQDVPAQGEATAVARVTFTPSTPGLHRYRFTAPPSPDDPVADNNSAELLIDVVDERPKILYIEGEPRWEYGKLRESVAEEKNITLVSALRSADGKFYRQGVENQDELAAGFPKSEEELFKYDAIMIGSVEATFFTFDQLKAIEQFVSRRGGVLLALGGAKSFNAGGYGNTPIADLLPVYLNGNAATAESQTFKAAPADRGRDHPAARLQDQAEANAKAWEQMPAITLPEVILETKPGATVILEARNTKNRGVVAPLLVEERYGRGRTLALTASDTWRWRMMMESKDKSFETFWRNLFRYLVDGTRRSVEASTERPFYGTGEAVRIRAEVADEKYININNAKVAARITSPSGRVADVDLKPASEGGFEGYAALFHPDEEGTYRVEVDARRGADSKQAAPLRAAQTSFIVGPLNREARDAAQNQELLKRIAADTGGQYYAFAKAEDLIEDLTHTEGAGAIRETKELWDMPINFLLVIGLAAGEWFVRKRKGLA
ncbi:MAG TPA: glutamine amidotransferase [Blastocatellia bacterium]|nr:glutamine amidotransferase [Blastocatellia bacterium]